MLLSKQESNIDPFFTRGRHQIIDLYYTSRSYFHIPKKTIRNLSNMIILFKQTLRDNMILFHDIAGLDKNLEEWKQLCRKAGKKKSQKTDSLKVEKVGILSEILINKIY